MRSLHGGTVFCWGGGWPGVAADAGSGIAGDASTSLAPQQILGIPGPATAIGASGATACVATASGVYCWGANESGQLGDGSMVARTSASATSGIFGGAAPTPAALGPGGDHTCVIAADGSVVCAGDDTNGALGNGQNASTDNYVASAIAGGAVAVGGGPGVSCALLNDGTISCWGFGGAGELGNAGTTSTNWPGPVSGITGATGLAVGSHHACAVSATGVFCWGNNSGGNLGDGSNMLQPSPVPVAALSGVTVVAVAAGGGTCALTNTGAVLCWGDNSYGQVGDGTMTARATPVGVTGLH